LFEIVFVGLGVDVPVEVLQVVAGDIPAVLGELDAEAVERASVQAGQETLDDELGAQVEPGHLVDDFRSEVLFWTSHDSLRRRGCLRLCWFAGKRQAARLAYFSRTNNTPSGSKNPCSS